MDLKQSVQQLLTDWQPGKVLRTAYDAAWVARLGSVDSEMSNAALNWISANQLPDGSWGAAKPMYYHDRVICTLAAMTALCRRGRRQSDRRQIEDGLLALERMTSGATMGLMADPNGATAGFETIVPTLVAEAEALGIVKRQGDRILGRLTKFREMKLARLNGFMINRHMTIAHSSEMAGPDHLHLFDVDNLQESNGSVAFSPSATSYFLQHVRPGDPAALAYLKSVVDPDGGTPGAAPFDVYERAWVLWNLALVTPIDPDIKALCRPHLDCLEAAWKEGRGVGFATGYSVQDGDDTSLAYAVLYDFGRRVDDSAIFHYEEEDHFRCYDLEANPSVSANVHMLDAFRRVGLERQHPAVQKILAFLRRTKGEYGRYWFDKWHISPYYTASHAVIACCEYDPELVRELVAWLLNSQNENGSWGFYFPSVEETAYVLQALIYWSRYCGSIPKGVVRRGANWLEEHLDAPYPALWIAKTLYYSEWVIRAEVLSALMLVSQYGE